MILANFPKHIHTHTHTHTQTKKDIKLRYLHCHPPCPPPRPPPLSDFIGNAGALGVCGVFPPPPACLVFSLENKLKACTCISSDNEGDTCTHKTNPTGNQYRYLQFNNVI